jgi:hypothetical protein
VRVAHACSGGFGSAAWLVPLLVALIGGIVFLEINVPQMIATTRLRGVLLFRDLADAFSGARAGLSARSCTTVAERRSDRQATLVLAFLALAVTVWITGALG